MFLMWFLAEAALIQCCLKIPHRNVLVTLVENDQIWTPESLHWTVKQISRTFLATRGMCFNWTRLTTLLLRTWLHKRNMVGGAEIFWVCFLTLSENPKSMGVHKQTFSASINYPVIKTHTHTDTHACLIIFVRSFH